MTIKLSSRSFILITQNSANKYTICLIKCYGWMYIKYEYKNITKKSFMPEMPEITDMKLLL